jgi:hypothetical protein
VLAMPITVSMKVVFQTIPELNRWAELMSLDWQSPIFASAATVDRLQSSRLAASTEPGSPRQNIIPAEESEVEQPSSAVQSLP